MRIDKRTFVFHSDENMALERKLDFIIAGTQKSGTTALHYFLEQHRQIAFSRKQELHFFDDDAHFPPAGPDYRSLRESFDRVPTDSLAGECTPIYTYWQPSLPRIRDYRPDIKLVVILRNPSERAFSHWNMQRRFGNEALDFLDAIAQEGERDKRIAPLQARDSSYVDRGFYSRQLERAFALFPQEQIHVLRNDDLRADPPAAFASVCQFLGLPAPRCLKIREKNSIRHERAMSAHERAVLDEIFADEIARLETMLGWDCKNWRTSQAAASSLSNN